MSDAADATFESILEDLYDPNSTTLPQSTQDYLDQVLSPPSQPMVTPMDLDFLDTLESLPAAGPDGNRCQWECQWILMIFELGRYTCYPSTIVEKDLKAVTQPVVEKELKAATQPAAKKDLKAAIQPAAKKDLKRILLNEDDLAERVIPVARKDLSKMFDEPNHPDTTNMSRHTEDFLLLEEGELDYEELDDTSTFGSGSSDNVKRPSTFGSGSSDNVKRPSTFGSGSRVKDCAKPIRRKTVHTLETAKRETHQNRRPASPIRRPSFERTPPPPATPMRRRMPPPHPYKENRFVSRHPTPSYRRNLFPNQNVKTYFHTKTLFCLAIRKNGFTLSNGSLSTSVDNDAEWKKKTLTNLILQKKIGKSVFGGLTQLYPDNPSTVSALIARDGAIYFRATDVARLLGYKDGYHFTRTVPIHKIRVADLVMREKMAYKNTWMLPYTEVIASMTSRKCMRRNFALAHRLHHVLTEGRGKWEFNRLLFKTSPCKAPKLLIQDSGEWVPQLLSVFRQKVMRYFYKVQYEGGQDEVVQLDDDDDDDDIIYKCDSVMPPTPYVKGECMDDTVDDPPSSQEPSGQEMAANDEPDQDYEDFDIDLSTPLVIVEDDLQVHTEQATLSTLAQNHKETIPSTETQTREKYTIPSTETQTREKYTVPSTATQKHEEKMTIDFAFAKVPDIIVLCQ
ncbi:hypothetical protein CEXT_649621 [Caerostris extrusa]|uniref:Uncharacterized protein n=1 Tax=Caerostris extrusa TaxID=172846 RepID=A0AAV4T8L4_CAEEX|nr:hypothetical protein CEXT_649621 [Caerostris extrusa]